MNKVESPFEQWALLTNKAKRITFSQTDTNLRKEGEPYFNKILNSVGLKWPRKETPKDQLLLTLKGHLHDVKLSLIQANRILTNKQKKIERVPPDRKILRFRYARYADDWIIITNAPKEIVKQLKQEYSKFLKEQLRATM